MRILISVDMEGISGVVAMGHILPDHKDYPRFRRLMTMETNAAVEGALAGGASRIVVNDSHAGMTNLLIEEMNPDVELISGSPKPFGMVQGVEEADAAFFIGYHAAVGTGGAVMEHTWSGRTVGEVRLNGQVVGETGLNAALAGAFGVPVVLVAGDQAVTEEARALLGEIETVPVKEGISRYAARCLHPETARQRIREAAERALRLSVPPFVVPPPITLRITFLRTMHADMAAMMPGSRRLDGRTVEWTGDNMPTVYRAFQAMTALAWIADRQS